MIKSPKAPKAPKSARQRLRDDERAFDEAIQSLISESEAGIRGVTALARVHKNEPRDYVILAIGTDSNLIGLVKTDYWSGEEGCVMLRGREKLVKALEGAGLKDLAARCVQPACGHFAVLLSAGQRVEYACSECDLEIVVEVPS